MTGVCALFVLHFFYLPKKRGRKEKKTPTKTVHKSVIHPAPAKINEKDKKTKTKKEGERGREKIKKKGEDRDGRNNQFEFR
jgi:hypothetical protein